jgi:hypothetical protein
MTEPRSISAVSAAAARRGLESGPQADALRGAVECELRRLPVDLLHPCPIQPRVSISVAVVRRLAAAMAARHHDPIIEVEPHPRLRGHYQIVCGEHRWRAAGEAGLNEVLARIHPPLGYLDRLRRQYEENQVRVNLDAVEEAHLLLLHKSFCDIQVVEERLRAAGVSFRCLEQRLISRREEVAEHLDELTHLLLAHGISVIRTAGGPVVSTLSPWRVTEQALGISEATRKAKVSILRLDPALLEEARALPTEHLTQIARLPDPGQQEGLLARAPELTHTQVRDAVARLRQHPEMGVEAAVTGAAHDGASRQDPLAFEVQMAQLSDLCRQLCRLLGNLSPRLTREQRDQALRMLGTLDAAVADFTEER